MTFNVTDGQGGGGGGGGYVFADGIGITTDTITNAGTVTISNTGTIVQPAATGTNNALGIMLRGGDSQYGTPGPLNLYGGTAVGAGTISPIRGVNSYLYNGIVQITEAGGVGYSGGLHFNVGPIYGGGGVQVGGGYISVNGATYNGSTIVGAEMVIHSGGVFGGAIGTGGALSVTGGDAPTQGGNMTVGPGSGATNGVLLVPNIGTVDPHILNAKWQTSVAGVGYVGVYSKG